jgi:hypothetical protein
VCDKTNFFGATRVSLAAVKFFREVNKPIGGRLIQASSIYGIIVGVVFNILRTRTYRNTAERRKRILCCKVRSFSFTHCRRDNRILITSKYGKEPDKIKCRRILTCQNSARGNLGMHGIGAGSRMEHQGRFCLSLSLRPLLTLRRSRSPKWDFSAPTS